MACPGGCTNGGGQVRVSELTEIEGASPVEGQGLVGQREWLGHVEGKYFEESSSEISEASSEEDEFAVKKVNARSNGYMNGDAMDIDVSLTSPNPPELTVRRC